MTGPVTTRQIVCLQILWNQHATRTQQSTDRSARLAWASQLAGRTITSFRDFTAAEAKKAIDTLKAAVDGPPTMGRDVAQAAGTEGRRKHESNSVTVASRQDVERIQRAIHRLGWSQQRFEGWLRSPRSPLRGRTQIRTLADANRVWWALKKLLKDAGKWREEAAS